VKVHVEFTADIDREAFTKAYGIDPSAVNVRKTIRRMMVEQFERDCAENGVACEILAVT